MSGSYGLFMGLMNVLCPHDRLTFAVLRHLVNVRRRMEYQQMQK